MLGNLLCFVRTHTHVRTLMTQKSCAVGMRNAKLGNHLKGFLFTYGFPSLLFLRAEEI